MLNKHWHISCLEFYHLLVWFTWSFQYDGQNRRIAESKNGVLLRTWVWNNTQIVEERAASGIKQRRWTGGQEQLNASNQPTGKRLLMTDHLGSARVIVDGTTGTTIASYAFSPWGKRSRISGTEDVRSGYTGHLWHESGLSLAVYRPYDPETGRWPSRDPIGEKGGSNLYETSLNNPVMNKDPSGKNPDKCCNSFEISAGEAKLNNRYQEAHAGMESAGISHGGHGDESCNHVNLDILMRLSPIPKCWKCSLENRYRISSPWTTHDHWIVICKARNDKGVLVKSIIFDYWEDRPSGENPNDWFRKRYPFPTGIDDGTGVPHETCDGRIRIR